MSKPEPADLRIYLSCNQRVEANKADDAIEFIEESATKTVRLRLIPSDGPLPPDPPN